MGSPAHRLDPPSAQLPSREAEALAHDGLLDEAAAAPSDDDVEPHAEAPPSDDDLCDGTDFSDDGATDDDISRVHFDDDGAGGELVSSLSMIQLDVSPSRSSWSACPTRLRRTRRGLRGTGLAAGLNAHLSGRVANHACVSHTPHTT